MWKPQKFAGPSHALKYETHTCALAAAAEAVGQELLHVHQWLPRWPFIFERATCPNCGLFNRVGRTVTNVIAHLNDEHHWTREQISDWVATVELADERSAQPEAVDAVGQRSEIPI
jgi:hypothetical protein